MSENLVDIDGAALDGEAAAVELPPEPTPAPPADGQAAPVAGEQSLEDVQRSAEGWRPGAEFMVNTFSDVLAPNWGITIEERSRLAGSLAMALACWFPDQEIPLKYVVLLQVAGAGWSIVNERRDPGSGKILPMRRSKEASPASEPSSSAPAAPGATGGFSTAA